MVDLLRGQILVAGGDCRPHVGGEFLSGASSAHQLDLHPLVGHRGVGLSCLVDVFMGLGEQLVVPFDGDNSSVSPVVGVTTHSVELL